MSTTSTAGVSTAAPSLDVLEVVADEELLRLEDLRAAARRRARHHRFMLWVTAAVIAGTFLLEVRPDQRVSLRGFPSLILPETCASKVVWGFDCPACGLTRSFIFAGRGEWLRSLEMNRMGFLLMLAVVAQIPYRLTMLNQWRRNQPGTARRPKLVAWLIIAALFVNWVLKMCGV